jgi:hypothetical protein
VAEIKIGLNRRYYIQMTESKLFSKILLEAKPKNIGEEIDEYEDSNDAYKKILYAWERYKSAYSDYKYYGDGWCYVKPWVNELENLITPILPELTMTKIRKEKLPEDLIDYIRKYFRKDLPTKNDISQISDITIQKLSKTYDRHGEKGNYLTLGDDKKLYSIFISKEQADKIKEYIKNGRDIFSFKGTAESLKDFSKNHVIFKNGFITFYPIDIGDRGLNYYKDKMKEEEKKGHLIRVESIDNIPSSAKAKYIKPGMFSCKYFYDEKTDKWYELPVKTIEPYNCQPEKMLIGSVDSDTNPFLRDMI